MAKYYGEIGFIETVETTPGVWSEVVGHKDNYYGDTIELNSRWGSADKRNDDLEISNRISILGDPYAFENFAHIKYAAWMGAKWKVTAVSVEYPRLVLTLGGVYKNEEST